MKFLKEFLKPLLEKFQKPFSEDFEKELLKEFKYNNNNNLMSNSRSMAEFEER